MKKFAAILLLVACVFSLCACWTSPKDSGDAMQMYFEARVTELHEERLLAEVTEKGDTALEPGTPVYVVTTFEGYKPCDVGDVIRVEFNSVIQESYPPIIPYVTNIVKVK